MHNSVRTIDRNVKTANIWLNEICDELEAIDKEDAWVRLNAVLRTVRDRLPVDEAADFAAQLPDILRGAYFGSWNPSATPATWRNRQEYLDAVNDRLGPHEPIDAEATIRAVLKVASHHLDAGALRKVKELHPNETWDLWPV